MIITACIGRGNMNFIWNFVFNRIICLRFGFRFHMKFRHLNISISLRIWNDNSNLVVWNYHFKWYVFFKRSLKVFRHKKQCEIQVKIVHLLSHNSSLFWKKRFSQYLSTFNFQYKHIDIISNNPFKNCIRINAGWIRVYIHAFIRGTSDRI